MNTHLKTLRRIALAATIAASTALTGTVNAGSTSGTVKLLTANFDARDVVQVEVGDFRFKPGQIAPIHTHEAPAVGYVAKGMIIYQVEGGKPQILRAGDAFFEPVGSRILRFDNASATEEAIFLDFNLEQANEPFIVFEETPEQAIDRRTMPTVKLSGRSIEKADIYTTSIGPSDSLALTSGDPVLGVVAEGVIEFRIKGQAVKQIAAGGTFALPDVGSEATIVNASADVPANVITIRLR